MACTLQTKWNEDNVPIVEEATPSQILVATFCVNADMVLSLPLSDETREKLLLLYDKYCRTCETEQTE